MTAFTLSSGESIPAIGLGTWQMEDGVAVDAVSTALEVGYRHIDGAAVYGNETDVGKGLAKGMAAGVSRDEIFVTSKLWNDSHKPEHVRPAIEKTLADLQLEQLDLYLIHWPVAIKHGVSMPYTGPDFISIDEIPLIETWEAMQQCAKAGLTKNVGVSNFSVSKLEDLMSKSDAVPAVNQVESHPFLPQEELFEFCKGNRIQLVAYSPLGSGARPERMRGDADPVLFENEVVKDVAAKHGMSVGQILLSFGVSRGLCVIPKSTNRGRLEENLKGAHFELPAEDIAALKACGVSHRFCHGRFFELEGSCYTADWIWK